MIELNGPLTIDGDKVDGRLILFPKGGMVLFETGKKIAYEVTHDEIIRTIKDYVEKRNNGGRINVIE